MLGRGVAAELRRGNPADVWAPDVKDLCGGCDVVICNLECCLSGRGRPTERVPGKPFFFRGPPAAVDSLRAIGVTAAGLANNHALDYEDTALLDTLEILASVGLAVAGAGSTLEGARRGAVVVGGEGDGPRIGLVSVADHPAEFEATPDSPGIAYADLSEGVPEWLAKEIAALRERCDHVVAFPHWGPNMTAAPARWQVAVARELIEAGADLVAGHSAHTFHGAGWADGVPVLYDLGDALDDYAVDATLRNDLGVMALWRPGEPELELVGLSLDYCHTRLAEGGDAAWIVARLERACAELGTRAERIGEGRVRVVPDS